MTPETRANPEAAFAEAPASWNTSYITPEGFVCRISLRGDTGRDVLEKAATALAFLLEHGYVPEQRQERRPSQHRDNGEKKTCLIHLCSMQRFERDGKVWFSHKLDDGSWCRGREQ